MKTSALLVLAALATVTLTAYLAFRFEPKPLSEDEKAEISSKVEWSGTGTTITGRLPLLEIPKSNPVFRIVREVTTGTSDSGYAFREEHLAIDFGRRRCIDLAKFFRNYDRTRRESSLR